MKRVKNGPVGPRQTLRRVKKLVEQTMAEIGMEANDKFNQEIASQTPRPTVRPGAHLPFPEVVNNVIEMCGTGVNEELSGLESTSQWPQNTACSQPENVSEVDANATCLTENESGSSYANSPFAFIPSMSQHMPSVCPSTEKGHPKDSDLLSALRDWTVQNNVPLLHVTKLLKILKPYHPDIPQDARTLLQTPRKTIISEIGNGRFCYIGLEKGLRSKFLKYGPLDADRITILCNIDGTPISNSSAQQIWPILCVAEELDSVPFAVAVYWGMNKPCSLHDYLKDFIAEIEQLIHSGFSWLGKVFSVTLRAFICDAPARAYLKCIKGHTGYFACEKCTTEGTYTNNRMTFPEQNAPLRKDEDFLSQNQSDHHIGVSPLTQLNFGLVTGFPLEYMHLVCLGVGKRILTSFMKGNFRVRLGTKDINRISTRLTGLAKMTPSEFSRHPRSLMEIGNWKATEFRQFVLYLGPVVLKDIVSQDVYNHFLALSMAITILCNKHLTHYRNYADQLLRTFVANCDYLYGEGFVVYNIHNLIHLAADAERHGVLDDFGAFKFETYLGQLKNLTFPKPAIATTL